MRRSLFLPCLSGLCCDEEGRYLGNIYSDEMYDAFLDREICIIEKYSEYDVPFTDGTKVEMHNYELIPS